MIDLVEERLDVHVDYPGLAAEHEGFRRPDRIEVATPRPEPIAVFTEAIVP
ncbi:hypothetical protein D3C76_1002520 [compost metagenome]